MFCRWNDAHIFVLSCRNMLQQTLRHFAASRNRLLQDMSDEVPEPEFLDPFSAAEIAAQSVLEQERSRTQRIDLVIPINDHAKR